MAANSQQSQPIAAANSNRGAGQPQVLHLQKIAPFPIADAIQPLVAPVSVATAATATGNMEDIEVASGARTAGGRDGDEVRLSVLSARSEFDVSRPRGVAPNECCGVRAKL